MRIWKLGGHKWFVYGHTVNRGWDDWMASQAPGVGDG